MNYSPRREAKHQVRDMPLPQRCVLAAERLAHQFQNGNHHYAAEQLLKLGLLAPLVALELSVLTTPEDRAIVARIMADHFDRGLLPRPHSTSLKHLELLAKLHLVDQEA